MPIRTCRPHCRGKTDRQSFPKTTKMKNSPTKEGSLVNVVEWILPYRFLINLTFCFALRKENIEYHYTKPSLHKPDKRLI